MAYYKKYLKQDQTVWLLEENNPSVRYFTMRELLQYDQEHPAVLEAKARIMRSKVVKMLLADQQNDGHWGEPGWSMHLPNTEGRLRILAELGADKEHPMIQKAVNYMLESWLRELYYDKSRDPVRKQYDFPPDWVTLRAMIALKEFFSSVDRNNFY